METFGKFGAYKVELIQECVFLESERIYTREAPVNDDDRLADQDIELGEIQVAKVRLLGSNTGPLRSLFLHQLSIDPIFQLRDAIEGLPGTPV